MNSLENSKYRALKSPERVMNFTLSGDNTFGKELKKHHV